MTNITRRLPREPEERHIFAPTEEVFNYISNDNRLLFRCSEEFREEIKEITWFTAWDGSKEYLKKFIRDKLPHSNFEWPYIEHMSEAFNLSGIIPIGWSRHLYNHDMEIDLSDKFDLFCMSHSALCYRYRDFLSYRNLIEFDPERWFNARVVSDKDCIISQNLCAQINKTLTKDIYDNDPKTCLLTIPYCSVTIEDCSRRRPLGTEPPAWMGLKGL